MNQNTTPVSFVGKHTFTHEEKEQKLQQMLMSMRQKEEIEAELKTTQSTYKAKINAKDAEIKLIANLLNAGVEDRTFQCVLTKDFDNGKRVYTEVGTNKVVGEEPLTAADYQVQMNLEEAVIKANNEEADRMVEGATEAIEQAGLHIVPDEPVELSPEQIAIAEVGPIEPEVINEPKKGGKDKQPIILQPTDELEADPFSDDDEDEDDDPFMFSDI
jgi:hypothetical protein